MSLHIGFTGTRNGMTDAQKVVFANYINDHQPVILHHGDCIGADKDAHIITANLIQDIVIHPPVKDDLRAFCEGFFVIYREPKTYFARNRDIVNECDLLIATPGTAHKTQGGTWYTIDYALKQKKPTYIILPDGTVVF